MAVDAGVDSQEKMLAFTSNIFLIFEAPVSYCFFLMWQAGRLDFCTCRICFISIAALGVQW